MFRRGISSQRGRKLKESSASTVTVIQGAREIGAEDWDQCANPPGVPYNPFLAHAFWLALEESGSASARKGWLPHHIVLRGGDGAIQALMPCYLKSHSFGEVCLRPGVGAGL